MLGVLVPQSRLWTSCDICNSAQSMKSWNFDVQHFYLFFRIVKHGIKYNINRSLCQVFSDIYFVAVHFSQY